MTSKVEESLRAELISEFVGYVVGFSHDPDDTSIVYADIYDVDEHDITMCKDRCWNIIDKYENDISDRCYIPSITRHDDTALFYSSYVEKRQPSLVVASFNRITRGNNI